MLETKDFLLPKRGLKDATLLKVIEGKDKLYVFSYIAVKKDQKNRLYAQIYDNTSGEVLENDGNLSIKVFKSGIVGGKENVVDFAPTKTIQLDNNTYCVLALGDKYQAFGKMTIK